MLLAAVIAAALLAAPPKVAPLTGPYQVLPESSGSVLVADGSGRIVRVSPRTHRRNVVASGLGSVHGIAYGPGGLYATTSSQVVRIARGKREVIARGLNDPFGIAVARDGTIYTAEAQGDRVVRIDGSTRRRTVIASTGLDQPLGVALRSDGSVLVADSHHGRVVRVAEGGVLEPVLEGLVLPVGVTAGPGGAVIVADHVNHDAHTGGRIYRLLPDGTKETLSSGKITGLSGASVARDGTLYATSFFAPFVGRVDAAGALRAI